MVFNGVVGLAAAALGWALQLDLPRAFILYWAGVGVAAMAGSFLLVRRQALQESEPFWSPPTRRVTQALLPPLLAGLLIGAVALARGGSVPGIGGKLEAMAWLPLIWVVLYGCAFHAAGFFMPRGMRLFGWVFILGGCGLYAIGLPDGVRPIDYAHGVMGCFFGGLHLAYGVYLYFTERRGNES